MLICKTDQNILEYPRVLLPEVRILITLIRIRKKLELIVPVKSTFVNHMQVFSCARHREAKKNEDEVT
jgi:hypothetical protein